MSSSNTETEGKEEGAGDVSESSSYEQAHAELAQIVTDLESSEVNIDTLATQVDRANKLIEFCQQRLAKVSEQLEEVMVESEKTD